MGFIRGALVVIACVILFVIFLAGNLFLTFTLSLKYDNVKTEVTPVIENALSQNINISQEFNSRLPLIQSYCQTNSEYTFSQGGYAFTVPCDVVSQGYDAVVSAGIQSVLAQTYYQKYDCNFLSCFKQNPIPFFLVSEKSRLFWKQKFYFALTLALILAGILFLLVEKKHNTFILPGILLIFASLPFVELGVFFHPTAKNLMLSFLGLFLSKAHQVFIISLILGISLLIVGIIWELFELGFNVKDFLDKFRRNKSEEEVTKLQKEVGDIKKTIIKGKKK